MFKKIVKFLKVNRFNPISVFSSPIELYQLKSDGSYWTTAEPEAWYNENGCICKSPTTGIMQRMLRSKSGVWSRQDGEGDFIEVLHVNQSKVDELWDRVY